MASSILQGNVPFNASVYTRKEVDGLIEEHSHYIVSPAGTTYIRPTDDGMGTIDRTITVEKAMTMTCATDERTILQGKDGEEVVWEWSAPEDYAGYTVNFVGPFTSSSGETVYVPSDSSVFDGFNPEAFYANLWMSTRPVIGPGSLIVDAGTEIGEVEFSPTGIPVTTHYVRFPSASTYDFPDNIPADEYVEILANEAGDGQVHPTIAVKSDGTGSFYMYYGYDSEHPILVDLQGTPLSIVYRDYQSMSVVYPGEAPRITEREVGQSSQVHYKNFPQWFTFSEEGLFIGHGVYEASGGVAGRYYDDSEAEVISDSRTIATLKDIGDITATTFAGEPPIDVVKSENTVTVLHHASGATSGNYGDAAGSRTVDFGDRIQSVYQHVDITGHINSISTSDIVLPSNASKLWVGDESNDMYVKDAINEIREEIGGGGGSSITERLDKLDAEVADLSNDLENLSNDVDSRLDDLSNDLATHEHSYIVNGSTRVQANGDGTASIDDTSRVVPKLVVPESFSYRGKSPEESGEVEFVGPYDGLVWDSAVWIPYGLDREDFHNNEPPYHVYLQAHEGAVVPESVCVEGSNPAYSISGWPDSISLTRVGVDSDYSGGDISVAYGPSSRRIAIVDDVNAKADEIRTEVGNAIYVLYTEVVKTQEDLSDLSNDVGKSVAELKEKDSALESMIDDLSNDVNSRLDDLSNDIGEVIDARLTEIEGRIDDLSNDVYSAIDDLSNDVSLRAMDDNVVHKTGPLVEGQTIEVPIDIQTGSTELVEVSGFGVVAASGLPKGQPEIKTWVWGNDEGNDPDTGDQVAGRIGTSISLSLSPEDDYGIEIVREATWEGRYIENSVSIWIGANELKLPTSRSGTIALQETIPSTNYATDAVYGIAKLSDATDSTLDAASGKTAATPLAVKTALDSASNALSSAVSSLQTEIGSKADVNHTHSSLSSDDGNSVMSILDSGNGRIQSTRKIAGDFSLECVEDFTINFDSGYNTYVPKFNGTTGMTISLKGPYPFDANTDVYVTTEYQGTPTAASFAEYGDFVGWYVLVHRTESTYLTDYSSCRYMARHTGNNYPRLEPIYNRTGVYDSQVIPLTANSSVVSVGGHVMDLHQTVDTSTSDRIIATTDQIPIVPTSFDRIVSPDGNTIVAASNSKVATVTYPTDTTTSVFFPDGFSITSYEVTYSAPAGGETLTFKGPYKMSVSGYGGGYVWYPTNLPDDPQEEFDPANYNPWTWCLLGQSAGTANHLKFGGNFGFDISNWGSEHPTLTVDESSEVSGTPPTMTRAGSSFVTRNLAFEDHSHSSIAAGDTTVSAVSGGSATITRTVAPVYGNMTVTFDGSYTVDDGYGSVFRGPASVEFKGPYYNPGLNYSYWYPTDLQDDPGTSFDPSNYNVWCLCCPSEGTVPDYMQYQTGPYYDVSDWESSSPKLALNTDSGHVTGSKPVTHRSVTPSPSVVKTIATTDGVVTSVNTRRGNVSLDATNLYMDSTQTQSIAQAIASIPGGGGIQSVNGDTGPDVLLDATNLYMDSNDQVTIAEALSGFVTRVNDINPDPDTGSVWLMAGDIMMGYESNDMTVYDAVSGLADRPYIESSNKLTKLSADNDGNASVAYSSLSNCVMTIPARYSITYNGVGFSSVSGETITLEGPYSVTIDDTLYYMWVPEGTVVGDDFNPFDPNSDAGWFMWSENDSAIDYSSTPQLLEYRNGPVLSVSDWDTETPELQLVSGTEENGPISLSRTRSETVRVLGYADDIPAKATFLPLMDSGEGSIGSVDSEYALSDHVHPSDTKKVSQGDVYGMFIDDDTSDVRVSPIVYQYLSDLGIASSGESISTTIPVGSDHGGVYVDLRTSVPIDSIDSEGASGSMYIYYYMQALSSYSKTMLYAGDVYITETSNGVYSVRSTNVKIIGKDSQSVSFATTMAYESLQQNGSAYVSYHESGQDDMTISLSSLVWRSGGQNPNTEIKTSSEKTLATTKYVDDAIAGGGGGGVSSVNGKRGAVVLDGTDILVDESNDVRTIAEAISDIPASSVMYDESNSETVADALSRLDADMGDIASVLDAINGESL